MPEEKKFKRLPTYVKPQVYHLFLKPDLNTFSFDGKETVEVQVNFLLFLSNSNSTDVT